MIRTVLISLPLAAVASTMAACGDEVAAPSGGELLAGAWTPDKTAPILEVTRQIALTAEPGVLTTAEAAAAAELVAAGVRLHTLYLEQVHPEGRAAEAALAAHPQREDLATLFVVMKGPIATTLTNTREPFLGVAPETPARGVYPPGTTREAFDAFLAAHPERRAALLHPRYVVWAATPGNRARALAALDEHSVLDTLHPNLRAEIETAETYLAVPYSVAWAEDILFVYDRLNAAAHHVAAEDPAFARFLRLRARDLLADDYDGGDAAWVSSRFTGHLNAQIGSYETYDDPLYGVKTFFALSLLQRDVARSDELAAGIGDIQAVEDALPYEANKRVRADIPVGAYAVIADFGQSRGANTATILPNEAHLSRQYGRTILIRGNIITHPELFAVTKAAYDAAIVDDQQDDLTAEGGYLRTLWHEVGHYLGADQTADGRELDSALQDSADLLEEMKADLVSLFASHMLAERGLHDPARLKAIQASGIRRVLQNNRPRRDQPYNTMQLIQWNWFVEHGVLAFEDGEIRVDYARYPAATEGLLGEVLELQRNGDRAVAEEFIGRWTDWDESRHGETARRIREAQTVRYTAFSYPAVGAPR